MALNGTCAAVYAPKVKFDYCAPDINYGQIDRIFLGNEGYPFDDVEDLVEWTDRVDNSDIVDHAVIRQFFVIGDKPAPEKTELKISLGRTVTGTKKHTINIKIDETNDDNYAFLQWLEDHSGVTFRCWYAAGKYLYGGNAGIAVNINLDDVIPEGSDALDLFIGALKFEGKTPDRCLNPMA